MRFASGLILLVAIVALGLWIGASGSVGGAASTRSAITQSAATVPHAQEVPVIARAQADYDKHIAQLKAELPAGFTVVLQAPFVVVGDSSAEQVRMYSEGTVAWAVEKLKKEYFSQDPKDLLTVYLFKDKASYEKYAKKLFGDDPSTPYGYYSPAKKALIMNISTGGGTLVHEIVHPFMETNFPACPAWFNEGMGSLYEQSGEKDGRIVGKTNWRLAGLQKFIKSGKVPSFEKLCAATSEVFYQRDKGTNYGQARYLCYYLQEKGLLQKYYQAFVKDSEKDPTGYKTLVAALGEKGKDMAAFQKEWEKWVLELTFQD